MDTGERCLPWIEDTQVVYEHLHRYHFAKLIVTGMRVLDLGHLGESHRRQALHDERWCELTSCPRHSFRR